MRRHQAQGRWETAVLKDCQTWKRSLASSATEKRCLCIHLLGQPRAVAAGGQRGARGLPLAWVTRERAVWEVAAKLAASWPETLARTRERSSLGSEKRVAIVVVVEAEAEEVKREDGE
jgi:hypothetical protein